MNYMGSSWSGTRKNTQFFFSKINLNYYHFCIITHMYQNELKVLGVEKVAQLVYSCHSNQHYRWNLEELACCFDQQGWRRLHIFKMNKLQMDLSKECAILQNSTAFDAFLIFLFNLFSCRSSICRKEKHMKNFSCRLAAK